MPIRRRKPGEARGPMSLAAQEALSAERSRHGISTSKRQPARRNPGGGRSELSNDARASLQVEKERRIQQSLQVEKKRVSRGNKKNSSKNKKLAAEYNISNKKKKINYTKLKKVWKSFATEDDQEPGLKVLYVKDFIKAVDKLDLDWGDDKCDRKFDSLDKNHDGVLAWEEFCKIMVRSGE